MKIFIPLIVLLFAQTLKFLINTRENKRFHWRDFPVTGRIPSVHTALVTSLVTVVGLNQGFTSSDFGIALVLAVIIVYDAMNLRVVVGQHSRLLNQLRLDLPPEKQTLYPPTNETTGHRVPEVAAGFVLGILLTLALNAII